MNIIAKNWKTTISIIITTITSLYQLFADNAEFLGIDNKYILGASIVITTITMIFNAITNGTGETKIEKIMSYFK